MYARVRASVTLRGSNWREAHHSCRHDAFQVPIISIEASSCAGALHALEYLVIPNPSGVCVLGVGWAGRTELDAAFLPECGVLGVSDFLVHGGFEIGDTAILLSLSP